MNCPNLRSVCVSKCFELTDTTLLALATYNHQLRTLEVAGCNQLTDSGFQALGKVSEPFKMWKICLFRHIPYILFRTVNFSREWIWKNVAKSQTRR